MRRIVVSLLTTIAVASGTPDVRAQPGYRIYHNERFGFSIEYPTEFRLAEPSDNGDGRRFIPLDGVGDFRAYGGFNALEQTGVDMFQDAAHDITQSRGVVTYAVRLANGFVVSGVIGSRVRYERVILSDANAHPVSPTAPAGAITVINTFWAEYPTNRKVQYDHVVSIMSQSLQPGVGVGVE